MYTRQFKHKPKLYIHIFPSTEFDWDNIKFDNEKKTLYVRHLFESHSSLQVEEDPKFWSFKTDGIFFNPCPSDVYATVLCEVFNQIRCGIDNVVMSYGQNYSGKTFTLSGLDNQFDLRGIVPRFLSQLLGHEQLTDDGVTMKVWLSIVDIDGKYIYNLLTNPINKCKSLKEVQKTKIKSEFHCLQLLFKGEGCRMNIRQKAYRSQVRTNVVTFTIELTTLNYHEPHDKISKIHFVDLAGIETIERNPVTSFKNQKNQSNANITKSLLEILALSFQQQKLGKSSSSQRIHKLTEYLGNSFSPRSYIKLICHIRPHYQDIMITLSALKFGMTFKSMPTLQPEIRSALNNERVTESLHHQVKSLQDELLMRDLLSESSSMTISQERISFVKRAVESFLKDELSEKELYSMVGDCGILLNVIKAIEKDRLSKESKELGIQTDASESLKRSLNPYMTSPKASLVKETTISNSSTKHVSFSKLKESKKTGGENKSKQDAKKGKEIIGLVSEEVQVNLIEPCVTLPVIDSRENMWARFMISHPEIEQGLSTLQNGISVKQYQLETEAAKLEHVDNIVEKVKLTIVQLTTDEALNLKLNLKKTGDEDIMLISEEKKRLLNELESLQQDMDVSQQGVMDAKIEWLEAVENMSKAKHIVEELFKKFCKRNNLLALYSESPTEKETNIVELNSKFQLSPSDYMKDYYTKLQSKYLHKNNCT